MLFELSEHIISETDLRNLANNGLKVKEHVIEKHIDTEKNIPVAAHKVLKD